MPERPDMSRPRRLGRVDAATALRASLSLVACEYLSVEELENITAQGEPWERLHELKVAAASAERKLVLKKIQRHAQP